eukprot:TRINITY_DN27257_c0_g1_i1.p1 TRINITY_DN27257_c0_g1~~TRINITY_DN27257_c0_g1_i1.p1  ORF type:complete len:722 (-),score=154.17 TRINITY_DN27257_c0_g1_i1:41-2206(-)
MPGKLTIKPFKVNPQLPQNWEEQSWKKLLLAVRAVQTRTGVCFSQEELYNAVQDMCLHKLAPTIYTRLRDACNEHIKMVIDTLVGQNEISIDFLTVMAASWEAHCEQMLNIKLIFGFLDRTFVIQNSLRSIWDMGLDLFAQYFSTCAEVKYKTVDGLLQLIQQERNGDTVDRSLIQKLIRMFLALQLYRDTFEGPFLERSQQFYLQEGRALVEKLPAGRYLAHVERRLHEENDRVIHYVDTVTRRPLLLLVETYLLRDHVGAILQKGFQALMEEHQIEDLSRLYHLFSLVHCLDPLRDCFKQYIRTTGLAIVMDEENDPNMVTELLQFKAKLDVVLEQAFRANEQFGYTLKDSFEYFVNQRQNKPAELIAKFIDSRLKGNKSETEVELDSMMDQVLTLFRFVGSKDVFEAFYKKDLAKRLLLGRSSSSDAEKSIIAKLKAECGPQLSGKLEGMFKDIELSKDIMDSFRQSKESRDPRMAGIELTVYVLTTGYWPTYPPCEVNLPKELAEHTELFKAFYLGKYQGRKLQWLPTLAQCQIRANFPKGRRELSVSLIQALVLLLFNDADELTVKEIQTQTGVEAAELHRTLQSLALGLVRVLKKRSKEKGKDLHDDDVFVFDKEFTHKQMRIKINQIQLKETPEEQKTCSEKVFADRQYQVDAAIVRVMKARKTLGHQQLIKELFTILKFPVVATDLKKRMESLIDRDYMIRDEENPSVYHYVA